jgi:hypothetical protein
MDWSGSIIYARGLLAMAKSRKAIKSKSLARKKTPAKKKPTTKKKPLAKRKTVQTVAHAVRTKKFY